MFEQLGMMGANSIFKGLATPSGPAISSSGANGAPITVGGINDQPGWSQLAMAAAIGAALVWWAKR